MFTRKIMDKPKLQKLSVKDFIKDSPSQRLKSIKLPRDLSLGGTKLHKKVYKPNLNAVRNKTNAENKLKDIDKPKSRHQKARDKKQRFVQSSGVFSEGIVSDHVPVIPAVKVRQAPVEKPVPVITKIEKVTEINKKREENVVDDIKQYFEDSDSDSDEKSAFKAIKWNESLFKKVKNEVEPHLFPIKQEFLEFDNLESILNLWQLPDSFNFKKDGNTDDFGLTDMAEGPIGKICIRRSGKVNVLIGELSYELESSSWESFNEHLLSVQVNQVSQASVLGRLQQRYILSPNWNNLL